MAPLLLDPPLFGTVRVASGRKAGAGQHGGFTLDEALTSVWEGLSVCPLVCCPVCGGRMAARERRDQRREGLCLDCGSRLA